MWSADRSRQFRRRSRSWRYEERTWRNLFPLGTPTVTMRKSYERKVVVSSREGYLVTDFFLLVASTVLCACFSCLFVSKTICVLHLTDPAFIWPPSFSCSVNFAILNFRLLQSASIKKPWRSTLVFLSIMRLLFGTLIACMYGPV